jgi:hypothetical protein
MTGAHLVGLVPHGTRNVVILGRAAGGVDEADGLLAHIRRLEGADEELVVRPVNRVTALEGQHVGVLGEL